MSPRVKHGMMGWMRAILALSIITLLAGGVWTPLGAQQPPAPAAYRQLDPLLQILLDSAKPAGRKHEPFQRSYMASPRLAETVRSLSNVIRIDGPGTGRSAAVYTVPVILHLKPRASLSSVQALGVTVRARIGDVAAVDVPLYLLEQVASLPEVTYVEASVWMSPTLETSTQITGATLLRRRTKDGGFGGITGAGVVVAIIDSGVDGNHPTFSNTLGNGNRFIGNSLLSDSDGHGTHVASIAAGNGREAQGGALGNRAGIAPEALIISKSMLDIPDTAQALQHLADIAQETGNRPLVVNMSFGHGFGAHDGSNGLERAIDAFVTETAGRAVVKSAGNEGSSGGHASANLSFNPQQPREERIRVNFRERGGTIHIWYDSHVTLEIAFVTPRGSFTDTNGDRVMDFLREAASGTVTDDRTGVTVAWNAPSPQTQGRDNVVVTFPTANTWQIVLRSARGQGRVDLWLRHQSDGHTFLSHVDSNCTVTIPGTSRYVITVGSHKNYPGIRVPVLGYIGRDLGLSRFSSRGPTLDGRIKPEICAPGEPITAAQAGGGWVEMQGTSMAAPHVTGAIALMLQKNPHLTITEIRDILMQTADRTDINEALPNNSWGSGRLDIATAVVHVRRPRISIHYPTSKQVANAGTPQKPGRIEVIASVQDGLGNPVLNLQSSNFKVYIGGKEVGYKSVAAHTQAGSYRLKVGAPQQDRAGKYRITIEYCASGGGGTIAGVAEPDAVEYIEERPGGGALDLVLIIDSSGSMSWNDPSDTRKEIAKRFIDFARIGDRIGVVDFDSRVRVWAPLTEVRGDAERQALKSAIDRIDSSGGTSIGGGLQQGYDLLSSQGLAGNVKAAILLSDGEHNTPPDPDEPTRLFAQRGWRVYTIALTGEADEALMQSIASSTGGRYLKAPSALELEAVWREIIGAVIGERLVRSTQLSLQTGQVGEVSFPVDSSMELLAVATQWSTGTVDVSLVRPDGSVVDPSEPNIEHTSGSDFEVFRLKSPSPGTWKVRLQAVDVPSTGAQVKVSVAANTPLYVDPFPLKTFYKAKEAILVSLSLREGDAPVLGAQVVAKVTRPGGRISRTRSVNDPKVERDAQGRVPKLEINVRNRQAGSFDDSLMLFDDGLHGDGEANDGVYANFYTDTQAEGTYIFNITATGADSQGNPFQREGLLTADVTGSAEELFSVEPSPVDLGVVYVGSNGGVATRQTFVLKNVSSEAQSVAFAASELLNASGTRFAGGYLNISPASLRLEPGEDALIEVHLELPASVAPGNYTGSIILQANEQSVQIPVAVSAEIDENEPSVQNLLPQTQTAIVGPQLVTMKVEDNKSGLLLDRIRLEINGQRVPANPVYNPDTKLMSVVLRDPMVVEEVQPLPPGRYTVTLGIPDHALNESVQTLEITVPDIPPALQGIGILHLPFQFDNPALGAILKSLPDRVVAWDPVKREYVPITSLSSRTPFWYRASSETLVEIVQRGFSVNQAEPSIVPLKAGWNLIGSPFAQALQWNASVLRIRASGQEQTLQMAWERNLIENYAWGWQQDPTNPFTGRYVLVYDQSIIPNAVGQLEPWKGYWIYAYQDCELILPPPSQTSAQGAKSREARPQGSWSIKLLARAGDATGEVTLGATRASRDIAIGLPPDPPTGASPLRVVARNGELPLAVDVRSESRANKPWEIEVHVPAGEQDTATLWWQDVHRAPRHVNPVLVDLQTGERKFLRTTSSHTFAVSRQGGVYKFRVELVPQGQLLRISQVRVSGGRSQGAYTVSFNVNAGAQVEVNVLSAGKVVRRLASTVTRSAGVQQVTWDGRDSEGIALPAGAYLVEIKAVSTDGQVVRATTPIVLTR